MLTKTESALKHGSIKKQICSRRVARQEAAEYLLSQNTMQDKCRECHDRHQECRNV